MILPVEDYIMRRAALPSVVGEGIRSAFGTKCQSSRSSCRRRDRTVATTRTAAIPVQTCPERVQPEHEGRYVMLISDDYDDSRKWLEELRRWFAEIEARWNAEIGVKAMEKDQRLKHFEEWVTLQKSASATAKDQAGGPA